MFSFNLTESHSVLINPETGIVTLKIGRLTQTTSISLLIIREYLNDPTNEDMINEIKIPMFKAFRPWIKTRENQDNRYLDMIVEAIRAGEIDGYKLTVSKYDEPMLEFVSPINEESTFGVVPLSDNTTSTMTLYDGFIEWDVEELEITEGIGIECAEEDNIVDGYDGVFELPIQAGILLYAAGYGIDADNLFEPDQIQKFFREHKVKDRDFDRCLNNLEKLHP